MATKEKEDYIRKYMLAQKEVTKLKDLLDHSEQIRQNQCALIHLQKSKIFKVQSQLEEKNVQETRGNYINTTRD
jgi:hypothetical protein